MRLFVGKAALLLGASLALAGCNAAGNSLFAGDDVKSGADAFAAAPDESVRPFGEPTPESGLLGDNPADDLSIGKSYFRAANYGMAEKYFRRAVESHPGDAEAWLDLAASYDHLKRFDLADRAYAQAIKLAGPKVEILNNQGYSYMLRGDKARAYEKLMEARRRDPSNPQVASNLQLLRTTAATAKAIE